MRPAIVALAILLGSLLQLSCGPANSTGPIPTPKFVFGEDLCDECSMIISEQRFAGAIGLRLRGRVKHLLFDDIGEMANFELPPHDEVRYFVHDMLTSDCLPAEEALYARAKTLRTPMGTGVAAFRSASDRDLTLEQFPGDKLTWEQLLRRSQ